MNKLVRLLLVASVLYGTGAHWAALQAYAWTSMSIAGQLSPCRVCKVVERGSTAKRAPALNISVDFARCVAVHREVVLTASTPSVTPFKPVSSLSARPFLPPPKLVLPA